MTSIFLTHCATKSEVINRAEESEVLRNRIKEYWQYRINGNVEKAYQCEDPAFREKVSILGYVHRFKLVKYLEADISNIEIEGEKAKASVSLTYRMLLPVFANRDLGKVNQERWTKIQGVWYRIPEGSEI